jgi:hypothetical protein
MAATPQPSFTMDAAVTTSFGTTSTNVALPGTTVPTDTAVRIINLGNAPVSVALGGSSVTAGLSTGVIVSPGQVPTFLAIPSGATYIAGIVYGPAGTYAGYAILNIATGS